VLGKEIKDLRVAILVPCYKRPEYTEKCIRALEVMDKPCFVNFVLWNDGSQDATGHILKTAYLGDKAPTIHESTENMGLRAVISSFMFDPCLVGDYDIIAKIDNDCIVPADYLTSMLAKFQTTNADILSPNVLPSNASYKYGSDDVDRLGYRPSKIVGGLWMMKRSMIEGIEFDRHDVVGIKGAFNLLYQIVVEKEPKIGWVTDVTVQDIGHWSGLHPDHIKNKEHLEYYNEIGREVAWGL